MVAAAGLRDVYHVLLPIFPQLICLLLLHALNLFCFINCADRFESVTPPFLTFVQDSVGRLVARQWLLAEVLVRLREALHLCKAGIERHGRVTGVLRHVQVSCPPQLLLYHERLLQQLEGKKENVLTVTERNVCACIVHNKIMFTSPVGL